MRAVEVLFQFAGLGFEFLLIVFVLLCFGVDFFLKFVGALGITGGNDSGEIGKQFVGMQAGVFGLVVAPLIGDLVLQNYFFGAGAVAEQGHDCDQHGKNRHGQCNGSEIGVSLAVFGVFLKFFEFRGHSVGLRRSALGTSHFA